MDAQTHRSVPRTIAFLLIPDFSMIAFAAAVEPLRLANRMSGRAHYRWPLLSKDGAPVRASNGISVNVDGGVDALPWGADAGLPTVILCSGVHAERFRDRELFAWLRRAGRHGARLGALCTGAHVLARAGLLEGYRCTIHWENLPGFREDFPDIDVAADLFEVDRDRMTCSGGTAALDMMLHMIATEHGEELAARVSEQCLLDRVRSPRDRQRMPVRIRTGTHHPKLLQAIEIMQANLEDPHGQDALAGRVGLSRRQLERLFRKHLGRSPAHYYLELRLERARHLLYQTDLPIMDIACACGFVSASHFSTCYRQMYGRTPRAERVEAA